MRLKNVLIVVNDMDRAIRFYKEIFGLQVILDQDGNKQCDKIQDKNDKLKMESKLAALENKLQKHEKYLPDIKELELQEVLRVYQVYLPAIQLVRERVFKVLESHEIFDNTLSPEEFEKLYNETK